MNGERIESVWDLLVARIAALELAVLELQKRLDELEDADVVTETVYDYMAEHDGWNEPETWIGGTDCEGDS